MRAVEHPGAGAVLETGIGHQIGTCTIFHLDLVQQAFANAKLKDLKMITVEGKGFTGGWRASGANELNGRPGTLGGFIAVRPVARLAVVAVGVFQFQRAAAAV